MAETKKKDPPDIGKGSEVEAGSETPEIGKGEELESLDEFDETIVSPDIGEGTGGPLSAETQEYLKNKGFKSADDLVKSHEGLEKRQTEVARDNRLNRLTGAFNIPPQTQERPAGTLAREEVEIPEDPSELLYDKDKFKNFIDKYGRHVEAKTLERVDQHLSRQEEQRILTEYNEVLSKDPEKFERLRPTMFQLTKRYPNASMQDLYDEADTLYANQKKKASDELLTDTFGPDVDKDKLKTLVSKMKPAAISTGSGGGQEIAVTALSGGRERAKKIKEDILGATKLTD